MNDNLGKQTDDFFMLREEKRELEAALEAVEERIKEKERELLAAMDAQGMVKITGKVATISIAESVKPSVEDWPEFLDYIHETKYFHLLDRRASVLGCRELFEKNGRIPGVVPYVQRKLRMLKT